MLKLDLELEEYMRVLKCKKMLSCYKDLAQKATESKITYEEYLCLLLEEEMKSRKESSVNTRIHKAHFPFLKTLEEFDFSFQPALNEKEVMRLGVLEFMDKRENLIFLGPPGVGKTHLAVGCGIKACLQKHWVLFTTASKLLEDLAVSVKDGSIASKLLAYSRLHLLIIDELGITPIGKEEANLLFQLVSMRYEHASIIVTSNYNFENWGQFFQDQVVAAAIIDRLVHHSKIFFINGSSYRLKGKLKPKTPIKVN